MNAMAEASPFETEPAHLLAEGRDFYLSKNYAASARYLEDYLKLPYDEQSEDVRQARYYIAMSAFWLRRDDAYTKLQAYQERYPYATDVELINLYRGILEYEAGKYKQAIKLFDQIKEEKLTAAEKRELHFYKGYAYIRQESYADAAYEFEQLVDRPGNPYEDATNYYYGYAEYQLGNYQTAVKYLQRVEKTYDFKETAPYLICQCYYGLGDCDRVLSTGKDLINKNPKNKNRSEVVRIVASCSYKTKNWSDALIYYKEYQTLNSKMLREDWYQAGIAAFNAGEYKESVSMLSKVTTKKDALTQNAYFHIGLAYLKLNDKKNARMAFEAAARDEYDKAIQEDALYNYALVTYELSYSPFNESVSAFERFLKEFPESKYVPKVYEYLVNVYLTTNNYAAAYASIQNINTNNPAIKEAEQRILFGMGTTAIANRNYTAAQKNFESILASKPINAELTARSYYWYGECLYKAGKYTEAKDNYNKFLKKTSTKQTREYTLVHYSLGYADIKLGNYEDAKIWMRKFVNLEKDDKALLQDAYNRIGDCYFAQRSYEQAAMAYREAQACGADLPYADYAYYKEAFCLGLQKNYNGKINKLDQLIARYPQSDWKDDALYEIGRTYVSMNKNTEAISAFERCATQLPKANPIVRKAKLQIAMLQYNDGNTNAAIATHKEIINTWPSSEEAKTSLESVESLLVESNQVEQYSAIAQKMGGGTTNKEDSLLYKAAEKVYFKENYAEATTSFKNYLAKYPNGKYHALAKYYLANCYYKDARYDEALPLYRQLIGDSGNPNLEFCLVRASSITYDAKKYDEAAEYFEQLATVGSQENRAAATTGLLRCHYLTQNWRKTISQATVIENRYSGDTDLLTEARYKKMKSYLQIGEQDSAYVCMQQLAPETRTEYGAEANYLVAEYLYNHNNADAAEKQIFDFIDKGTSHAHWMAKAFVLLSDIYISRDNYFEAKQYLLSLRDNYVSTDLEINEAIASRLATIEQKEKETTISNE